MILCIETATSVCSVALCDSNRVVSLRESIIGKSHAELLTVFIDEIFKEKNITAQELDAIAVSKGPGSYTGLRIGVSVAKGIVYASGVPLIGVETLTSMYYGFLETAKGRKYIDEKTLFCPVLDARRMEVYYCIYDSYGKKVKEIAAETISENSFTDISSDLMMVFFGNGADKCSSVIKRNKQVFMKDFELSASYMRAPAYKALNEENFENTAYFEPFYLKDFLATRPKKKLF